MKGADKAEQEHLFFLPHNTRPSKGGGEINDIIHKVGKFNSNEGKTCSHNVQLSCTTGSH